MEQQSKSKLISRFLLVLLVLLIVAVFFIAKQIVNPDKSESDLPTSFPPYANATKVALIKSNSFLSGSCDNWAFGGEQYQAYITSDSFLDISTFYRQIAKNNNINESQSDYVVSDSSDGIIHFASLCFWGNITPPKVSNLIAISVNNGSTGKLNRSSNNVPDNNTKTWPTTFVGLIDNLSIIHKYVKDVPANTNYLVLVMQGFIHFL